MAFDIDLAVCRSIVVKLRAHFLVSFQNLFLVERTPEIDVLGLASPNSANFDCRYLPRSVFPLDLEAAWEVS